jgi:hypothetical protein
VDERGITHRGKDAFQVIVNRKHETGSELADWGACIHEGWRVWEKFERTQCVLKPVRPFAGVSAISFLHGRDVAGHPAEHVFRRFDDSTFRIFAEVAGMQQLQGR